MPRKKRSELSAGIFVIVTLGSILGVVLWLGASDVLKPTRQRAFFYAKEGDTGGNLEAGSFVEIAGAKIGQIVDVDLVPAAGRTFYIAEIERGDVKIHSDGTAKIEAGLVGVANLSVTRGSEDKPLADSEQSAIEIAGGPMEMLAKQLDETVPDSLIAKLKGIAANILRETAAKEVGSAMAKLHKSLSHLQEITANIRRETSAAEQASVVAKVHGIVDDVKDVTGDIGPKVKQTVADVAETAAKFKDYTKKDLAEILTKLREANTEILKVAKDFGEVSQQTKEIVLVNRENIDEMIDNMTIVSANLKASSKEIRRNPWRLLYKPKPEELREQNIYDATTAFLGGAEQLDDALSKLTGLSKAYPDGIDPKDPKFQEIRKQVLETFTKFKKAEDALWKEFK